MEGEIQKVLDTRGALRCVRFESGNVGVLYIKRKGKARSSGWTRLPALPTATAPCCAEKRGINIIIVFIPLSFEYEGRLLNHQIDALQIFISRRGTIEQLVFTRSDLHGLCLVVEGLESLRRKLDGDLLSLARLGADAFERL